VATVYSNLRFLDWQRIVLLSSKETNCMLRSVFQGKVNQSRGQNGKVSFTKLKKLHLLLDSHPNFVNGNFQTRSRKKIDKKLKKFFGKNVGKIQANISKLILSTFLDGKIFLWRKYLSTSLKGFVINAAKNDIF
jgi:hypothetical protein